MALGFRDQEADFRTNYLQRVAAREQEREQRTEDSPARAREQVNEDRPQPGEENSAGGVSEYRR